MVPRFPGSMEENRGKRNLSLGLDPSFRETEDRGNPNLEDFDHTRSFRYLRTQKEGNAPGGKSRNSFQGEEKRTRDDHATRWRYRGRFDDPISKFKTRTPVSRNRYDILPLIRQDRVGEERGARRARDRVKDQ